MAVVAPSSMLTKESANNFASNKAASEKKKSFDETIPTLNPVIKQ